MKSVPDSRIERLLLGLILLGYAVIAALFALRTPAWQTPDEPAHYNYAAQIARDGCCPVITEGDWDSPYLEQLKAARFAPELLGAFDRIQYEDHQPPLYYLVQALVFRLSDGSLAVMRLVSAAMGLGIVVCVWAVARRLTPGAPQIALAAAAFAAFLPQHVALLASVNNDSLAWLLIAVLIWLTVRYTLGDRIPVWLLGVLMGIALLTKISSIFLLGVIGLAILWRVIWAGGATSSEQVPGARYQRSAISDQPRHSSLVTRHSLVHLLQQWTLFLLPALLLAGIWWARNISVYGFPDLFGLREHDRIVADQLRTAAFIADNGLDGYWAHALRTTFTSFWGQFGWMGLPLWDWLYILLLGVTALLMVGLVGQVVSGVRRPSATPPQRSATSDQPPATSDQASPLITSSPHHLSSLVTRHSSLDFRAAFVLLALCALLAALQYAYYNLEFLQLQARYMFTGITPFAIGLALGMDAWRGWLLGRWGWARWLTPLPFMALALLDLYLIVRVIEPLLRP
jgi:hypothetical protein